ncbi:MAG: hypothetical protein KGM47_16395 [Acidobacteriota bacterium]|nr:hypothetical protein [Acidobacteriota bacterium]
MKRSYLPLAAILMLVAINAKASKNQAHTRIPENARYQIIESSIALKNTFKLDTYTGTSWQLVQDPDGALSWELLARMPFAGNSKPLTLTLAELAGAKVISKGETRHKISYGIYTSGIAIKNTFLINFDNGHTLLLVENSHHDLLWEPFK